jgi:hypothetical protein
MNYPADWRRCFVCYFHFVGWDCISLGGHVCLGLPNVEVHLPFGFVRVGWVMAPQSAPFNYESVRWRTFGIGVRY